MQKNKNKKRILKIAAEFIVLMLIITFVLTISSSLTLANGSLEDRILIAADDPAGGSGSGRDPSKTNGTADDPSSPPTTTPKDTKDKPKLIPIPDAEKYGGQLESLTPGSPDKMIDTLVQGLVKNFKYLLAAAAVLYIMLAAVKLIMAGDNEETVTKQKAAITYGIIGLIVIAFADNMTKVLSVACIPGQAECVEGGFLTSPQALIQQSGIFNREVKILITFIKYLIGGIAVLMLVRNGVRFVALQGNEESVGLDKKNLAFTSIGLVLIIIASTVIDKVLFIVDVSRYPTTGGVTPAINPERGVQELVGFTNLIVTFTAPAAILVLIIGAVMYATAGGNEEQMNKAKRMIILAVIGMIIIYGAFAIISTIISGQFSP